MRGSVGRVRAVRGWITLGLGLWLLRALVRDVVLLAGLDVSPVLTTMPSIGVLACGMLAFVASLRGRHWPKRGADDLPGRHIIFFATAALILTTSAEAAAVSVANAVFLAHAIFFLGLSGAMLLLDLTVRAERAPRGAYLILVGIALLGAGFLAEAAIPAPISGHEAIGPAHLLVALGVISVGLGTATWTDVVDDHPGYARFAARLRSLMPMGAVALTALLLVVHVLRQLGGVVGVVNIVTIGLVLLTWRSDRACCSAIARRRSGARWSWAASSRPPRANTSRWSSGNLASSTWPNRDRAGAGTS